VKGETKTSTTVSSRESGASDTNLALALARAALLRVGQAIGP
jgi:hypothetical protein